MDSRSWIRSFKKRGMVARRHYEDLEVWKSGGSEGSELYRVTPLLADPSRLYPTNSSQYPPTGNPPINLQYLLKQSCNLKN